MSEPYVWVKNWYGNYWRSLYERLSILQLQAWQKAVHLGNNVKSEKKVWFSSSNALTSVLKLVINIYVKIILGLRVTIERDVAKAFKNMKS